MKEIMKQKHRIVLMLIMIVALLIGISLQARAEENPRIAFGGVGYFAMNSPNVKAFGGMAIPITADGKTISFTDFDLSLVKPGTGKVAFLNKDLQYSIKTGLGYRALKLDKWSLYGMGAPGIETTGDFTAAKFEYGGLIHRWVYQEKLGLMFILSAETFTTPENKISTEFSPRIALTFKF